MIDIISISRWHCTHELSRITLWRLVYKCNHQAASFITFPHHSQMYLYSWEWLRSQIPRFHSIKCRGLFLLQAIKYGNGNGPSSHPCGRLYIRVHYLRLSYILEWGNLTGGMVSHYTMLVSLSQQIVKCDSHFAASSFLIFRGFDSETTQRACCWGQPP